MNRKEWQNNICNNCDQKTLTYEQQDMKRKGFKQNPYCQLLYPLRPRCRYSACPKILKLKG